MDKKSKLWKTVATGLLLAGPLAAEAAFAQTSAFNTNAPTIGQISKNVVDSLSGASLVVLALAYLGAMLFAWIGILKWKAHGEQPDRTPFKVPLMYWAIAVACAAFPEFIGVGIVTLLGSGAQTVPAI